MTLKYRLLKKCPVCDGSDIRDVLTKRTTLGILKTEASQTYALCADCSFLFTRNPLEAQYLERYYASNTQERKVGADENEVSHMRDQIDFLEHSLGSSKAAVLEIGANNGSFLTYYGAKKSYYSELNKDSLAMLKKNKKLKDFRDISPKKRVGMFDQIILLHTLEHIVQPKRFLLAQKRFLKEGGVFFVEVPDFTFCDTHTDDFMFEHVNFYSEKTLRELFQNAGLTVIASEVALDPAYPACPKYVVRMVARKASNVFPERISARIVALRKKEKNREASFKRLNVRLAQLGKGARIGIYSASWLTRECLEKTTLRDYNIVAIFDRDKKKQGTTLAGIPVKKPSALSSMEIEHMFVLNEGYENEIRHDLQKLRFPKGNIHGWSDFT